MGMQLPEYDDVKEKPGGSAIEAISQAAGSLPSSLKELKESVGIINKMRDGSSSSSATENTIGNLISGVGEGVSSGKSVDGISSILKNLPEKVASEIIKELNKDAQRNSTDNRKEQATKPADNPKDNSHPGAKPGDASDITREMLKKISSFRTEVIKSDQTGVINLSTGDKFVRVPGVEVLIAPNGDTLVVNKDGSFDVGATKGVSIKHDRNNDLTTLTYPNGDMVRIHNGRITDVERGLHSIHMNSAKEDLLGQLLPVKPPEPQPWPRPIPHPVPYPLPYPEPKPWPRPESRPWDPADKIPMEEPLNNDIRHGIKKGK